MRVLLDTHVLLWALGSPERLTKSVRDVLEDPSNDIVFSAASIWEIAIKAALGRADFAVHPDRIAEAARETGFLDLPVSAEAAARVADMPMHHRDPFDRVLIAQAMLEPMQFYTADAALRPYSELVCVIS